MRRRRRRRRGGGTRTALPRGAAAGRACARPSVLVPPARVRSTWLLPVLRRQRLVFGPLLAQPGPLLRRHLGDALVVLARLPALLDGELGPRLHAPLHAL